MKTIITSLFTFMQLLVISGCDKHANMNASPVQADKLSLSTGGAVAMGANPALNPATDSLLRFIQNLKNQPGKRILAGQNSNISNKTQYKLGDDQIIHPFAQATGKYPAIVGSDFNDIDNWNYHSPFLKDLHQQHQCIIEICGGLNNPGISSGSDLSALLPGGSLRAQWVSNMDAMAAKLAYFQTNGVSILYRPFHEMNGSWTWYYTTNYANFRALWADLFDYFTNTKNLNNLIWIYAPNNNVVGDGAYTNYYPGTGYVDIVGADVYDDNMTINDYSVLRTLAKPIMLTEFGTGHGVRGNSDSTLNGTFDYNLLAEKIRTTYPNVIGWLCWHDWNTTNMGFIYKSMYKNNYSNLINHSWMAWANDLNY
ncbi:glycoside hydrolase family 26 protein [Chitinophaga sp.]|uniref:glycoside hydrolase family 26 protein n=1 Tax=Chitinophaga sp. TaxID=1869181 RepID=UPI002CCB4198|nr:glycosyl hydrolase [Chitinophaga sp.]HWV67279.1 glycosyl hydrolase [Chitinophaga sp.]